MIFGRFSSWNKVVYVVAVRDPQNGLGTGSSLTEQKKLLSQFSVLANSKHSFMKLRSRVDIFSAPISASHSQSHLKLLLLSPGRNPPERTRLWGADLRRGPRQRVHARRRSPAPLVGPGPERLGSSRDRRAARRRGFALLRPHDRQTGRLGPGPSARAAQTPPLPGRIRGRWTGLQHLLPATAGVERALCGRRCPHRVYRAAPRRALSEEDGTVGVCRVPGCVGLPAHNSARTISGGRSVRQLLELQREFADRREHSNEAGRNGCDGARALPPIYLNGRASLHHDGRRRWAPRARAAARRVRPPSSHLHHLHSERRHQSVKGRACRGRLAGRSLSRRGPHFSLRRNRARQSERAASIVLNRHCVRHGRRTTDRTSHRHDSNSSRFCGRHCCGRSAAGRHDRNEDGAHYTSAARWRGRVSVVRGRRDGEYQNSTRQTGRRQFWVMYWRTLNETAGL